MNRSPTIVDLLKEIYRIWITERPTQLAAALAYYGMFSIAPVIYIGFTIASIFIRELSVANIEFERIQGLFGPEVVGLFQDTLANISLPTEKTSFFASLVSFIALLLAASGMFFQIQFTMNTIWKVPLPQKGQTMSFIRQRLFSFLMVICVGLLLIVVALLSIILSWLDSVIDYSSPIPVLDLLGFVGLTTLSLALIYKFVPDTQIAWRDVWLGALVTTILITAGGLLVGLYLSSSQVSSAFQAAGSFAVLLIGIYYIAQIFLLGAVFTRVYAHMFGSKRTPAESTA